MIEFGLGVGFLPLHLAAPYERSERLWTLPPYDDIPSDEIYLINNPETNFSQVERLFLKQLLEVKPDQ